MSDSADIVLDGIEFLRGDRFILKGIDWVIESGSQAAILGPNGSGKSTLVRILLGYLWPTRGSVTVLGKLFGEYDLHELRKTVRLVQSNSPFEIDPDLSVQQAIFTGYDGTLGCYSTISSDQEKHIDELIYSMGLGAVRKSQYFTLSTGERVRTLLARALVTKPRVLILDEPTAGLDIRGRMEFLSLIDSLSKQTNPPSIITVTHHVEELPRGTENILLLDQGTIARIGTTAEIFEPALLSRIFGCPVQVQQIEGHYYLHATGAEWKL